MPQPYDRTRPWTDRRVRDLRHVLRLSQAELGREMNVSAQSVRAWEQGYKHPSGTAVRLLDLFESHPHLIGDTRAAVARDSYVGAHDADTDAGAGSEDAVAPAGGNDASDPLPEWWREATIARLVTALYWHVRQFVNPYAVLVAPRAVDGVSDADARAGYPDVYVIDPEAAIASRRAAITSLRLAIDLLPLDPAATPSVTAALRLRKFPIEEHWLVDPVARRVTVRRVADSTTRHHRREIVWYIVPHLRPLQVAVRPLFLPYRRWPSLTSAPSPRPVGTPAAPHG